MKNVVVNGRTYAWPKVTTVVVCIDGSEPEYIERAIADGIMPNMAAILEKGADLAFGVRHAELHQPQQPLDRDGPTACGSRYCRQLLSRAGNRREGDDERSEVPARAADFPGVSEGRGKDRGHHGEGQAPPAAGPWVDHRRWQRWRRHLLFLGEGGRGVARREWHRECAGSCRATTAGGVLGGTFRLRSWRRASRLHVSKNPI